MGLLGKDGTGVDSGQPIVSAYTPSIVKRHKCTTCNKFFFIPIRLWEATGLATVR